MDFLQLRSHLELKKYRPCYVLNGDDDYLINNAAFQICSVVKDFKEFNVESKEFSSPAQLIESCNTLPLASNIKVVDCLSETDINTLQKYLDLPNPSVILILRKTNIDFKKPLHTNIELINCNRLEQRTLMQWIKGKAKGLSCQFNDDAAQELIIRCNSYMSGIFNETKKLADYRYNDTVTKQDVIETVTADLEYKIFDLSDAVAKKNAQYAMAVLNDMLKTASGSAVIFGLLYKHFRRLLYIALSGTDICIKHFKINPYFAKILSNQAKNYSIEQLKKIMMHLHFLDESIKQGKIALKPAMEEFVCRIIIS